MLNSLLLHSIVPTPSSEFNPFLKWGNSSPLFLISTRHESVRCFAKKKIGFMDQILDYIEGADRKMSCFISLLILSSYFFLTRSYFWLCCLILGGPKLRKWYGAPDLVSKNESALKDEDEYSGKVCRKLLLLLLLPLFWG